MRLRRVSCDGPGLTRVRRGRSWQYRDAAGRPVRDPATLARIEGLVLPPAWRDVWICPIANGHLQATGVDTKGRRQYRYHDAWRVQRDLAKHERILEVADRLPSAREAVARDLRSEGLTRRRVLAGAFRLLDVGFFRIGGERYALANSSYGLATIRRDHVTVSRDGTVTFDFTAKSGKHRVQRLGDPELSALLRPLKQRRGGGPELLAYRDGSGRWADIRSADINAYVRETLGIPASAKDFRTWSATVLAAAGLAVSAGATATAAQRKRAVSRVVQEVAGYLGNTPAVCRASYIDPRLFDLFEAGEGLDLDLRQLAEELDLPGVQGAFEAAVRRLLRGEPQPLARAG